MGRCENGFDSKKECQCDSMCKYYKSCCSDYEAICGRMSKEPLCSCFKSTVKMIRGHSYHSYSPSARGDTFVFAEDDDYDELFEGTTTSPGHSAQSGTVISHQPKSTHQPLTDFGDRPQHHPETKLEMTKPPRLMDATVQRASDRQMTHISATVPPTQTDSITAEAMTTGPVTTATTQAPDPDAEVCSGRPFDSFMQLKNGSIYAFRGE